MAKHANPVKAYRETQIKTASQGRIIVMIYDEAIKQVDAAISGLSGGTGSLEKVNAALVKSQDLITELMVSLDFQRGGEIAENLFTIYLFFNRQLSQANIKKDPTPLRNVRTMLADLRSAWASISGKSVGEENASGSTGLNIAG